MVGRGGSRTAPTCWLSGPGLSVGCFGGDGFADRAWLLGVGVTGRCDVTMEIAGDLGMTTTRRRQAKGRSEDNGATTGYESQLWQMADALPGEHGRVGVQACGCWGCCS